MKLFCKLPFGRISIDDDGNIWPSCCPDWVQFPMGNVFQQEWEEIWYGEAAKKLRGSMFDGSLRYCKRNWCPNVADAESGLYNYHVVPVEQAPETWQEAPPIHINLNYDQTCNLRCPSCRADFIHYKGDKLKKVEFIQSYVEEKILPGVESIALTGVGDPFYSPVFRKFLQDFDPKKYPKLKTVHLHTNGQLFDERMYNRMPGLHHLRLSTDISIDAATAEVYGKVRPPGDWDKLMKNLDFIKRLDNLVLLGISMVVQQDNYRDMMKFVELGESLTYRSRPTFIEFKRMRHDPHLNAAQYVAMGLEGMTAAQHQEFLDQLHRVEYRRMYNAVNHLQPEVRHNLHEFVTERPVVRPSRLIQLSSMVRRRMDSFLR